MTKRISVYNEVANKLEALAKTEGLTVYQLIEKWYEEGLFDSRKLRL